MGGYEAYIFIFILIAIIIYIVYKKVEKNQEEEQKEKEDRERAEKTKQETNIQIENMKNSEFFRIIQQRIFQSVEKGIIEGLRSGHDINIYSVPNFFIHQSSIAFGSSYFNDINFIEMGYKPLSSDQQYYLSVALRTIGYYEDNIDNDYWMKPEYSYWKPVLDRIVSNYSGNLKDIY